MLCYQQCTLPEWWLPRSWCQYSGDRVYEDANLKREPAWDEQLPRHSECCCQCWASRFLYFPSENSFVKVGKREMLTKASARQSIEAPVTLLFQRTMAESALFSRASRWRRPSQIWRTPESWKKFDWKSNVKWNAQQCCCFANREAADCYSRWSTDKCVIHLSVEVRYHPDITPLSPCCSWGHKWEQEGSFPPFECSRGEDTSTQLMVEHEPTDTETGSSVHWDSCTWGWAFGVSERGECIGRSLTSRACRFACWMRG